MVDKNDYSRILELIHDIDGKESLQDFVNKANNPDIILRSDGVIQVDNYVLVQRKDDLENYFTIKEDIDTISYTSLMNILKSTQSLQTFKTKANRMLGKDLIDVYGTVIRFNNKNFRTKQDVMCELSSYKKDEYIDEIKKQCMDVLEVEDGLILDGVAYLLFEKPRTRLDLYYPIIGYLNEMNRPVWFRFNQEYFIASTADNRPIKKLYTLDDKRYKFYKQVYITDIGVITKPYPVMIYENSKQCFSYKGTGGLNLI